MTLTLCCSASGIPPHPASAPLFKHTCSIIWLRIPWQRTLALDLLTSFPDCDNHPLKPSMESNIMVICWGHCSKLILQQTYQRHINHCQCRVLKIYKVTWKFSLKSYFHFWNFWRTVQPGDKHSFPYKHLILCVPITLWCHIFVSSTKALSPAVKACLKRFT